MQPGNALWFWVDAAGQLNSMLERQEFWKPTFAAPLPP